jgi:hypothetical protein
MPSRPKRKGFFIAALHRPLAKVDFRPPNPPSLGGTWIQSPPILVDLGGIPGFMQEV